MARTLSEAWPFQYALVSMMLSAIIHLWPVKRWWVYEFISSYVVCDCFLIGQWLKRRKKYVMFVYLHDSTQTPWSGRTKLATIARLFLPHVPSCTLFSRAFMPWKNGRVVRLEWNADHIKVRKIDYPIFGEVVCDWSLCGVDLVDISACIFTFCLGPLFPCSMYGAWICCLTYITQILLVPSREPTYHS